METTLHNHNFRVIQQEVDEQGSNFLLIAFPIGNDREGVLRIERGLLLETQRAKVVFANKGAVLPANWSEVFSELLAAQPPIERVVRACGWYDTTYISRYGRLTNVVDGGEVQLAADAEGVRQRRTSGTRREFFKLVRPLLESSPYLIFSYLLALTAPLAARVGIQGGFSVCYCGDSSVGKSSCLRLAQSLVANADHDRRLEPFGNSTGKTLDTLPIYGGQAIGFGDLKREQNNRAIVEKLRTLVFSGSEGSTRHRKYEVKPPETQFSILMFSAETPLSKLFGEQGLPFQGGDAVRLIDVPVPDPSNGGIFFGANQRSDILIAKLKTLLEEKYGTILPHWVEGLSRVDPVNLRQVIERRQRAFVSDLGVLPSQHGRIADLFGLVAAVGRSAVKTKMIPVDRATVYAAVMSIFRHTIGRLTNSEAARAEVWQRFFTLLEELPTLNEGEKPSSPAILGFYRGDGGHKGAVFLRRDKLQNLIGADVVREVIIPGLIGVGALASTGEKTVAVKQRGMGRKRYFRLSAPALITLRTNCYPRLGNAA